MVISQSIESISGLHPEAASDFTLFCEVVVPALDVVARRRSSQGGGSQARRNRPAYQQI
jgi:hypothetical protein